MSAEAARLRCLFAARDAVARRLAELDKGIAEAGDAYRVTRGYSVRLRPEILRKEVGA